MADGSVWRNRDFRLLWAGQTVSDLGSGVTSLAYPLLMLALTHSPAQAGAVAAVCSLPYLLFGLLAGSLADRWNRKRTMVVCEACRAVNVLSIPCALWWWHVSPMQVYLTGFIGGVLFVMFSAADAGALPHVVGNEQLTSAVAAQQATSSATAVVAPILGGSLFQILRALPFLADAVSYLASATALTAVGVEFQQQPRDRTRGQVTAGVRWVCSHPVLRNVAIAAAGLQLAMAGAELVVIVAARQAHASATLIGVVLAAVGVGGVLGSLVSARLRARFGFGRVLVWIIWSQAVLWILIGWSSRYLPLMGLLLVAFVATAQIFGITVLSYQLSITPDHLLSRVGTAFRLIAWSSSPLGAAVAGLLLTWLGPSATSAVFGAWVSLIAIGATRAQDLRRPDLDRGPVVTAHGHESGARRAESENP